MYHFTDYARRYAGLESLTILLNYVKVIVFRKPRSLSLKNLCNIEFFSDYRTYYL